MKRMETGAKLVSDFLQKELIDVLTGRVSDDEGLMKEHKKLLALAESCQTLSLIATIEIQGDLPGYEPMRVAAPMSITSSFWKEE